MKLSTPRPKTLPVIEQFWWRHDRGLHYIGVLVLLGSAVSAFIH